MSELISEIQIRPISHATLKASGSFLISEAFEVKFTVVKGGTDGMFVSLPRRQYTDKEGKTKYSNEVYCTSDEARKEYTKKVMEAYKDMPTDSDNTSTSPAKTTKKAPF